MTGFLSLFAFVCWSTRSFS